MDDDLLADDGPYKDDELDDLDVTEEAALLGLSDEELDSRDNEELEYVDEDGNPVEIGENNAELYEFANVKSGKRSADEDEDVLELDLEAEIESFTQENPDLVRESPVKGYERQHRENLISVTSRSEQGKSRINESPDRHSDRLKTDSYSSSQSVSVRHSTSESYSEPLAYEDESDSESIDDHRERFKSERSNIITLTPANKRDIPDTLESVISVEENAKVQAFLEQEQQRKMRSKGGRGRNRNQNFNRHQSYQHQSQHHHHHQSAQHQHHQSSPHQHHQSAHQHQPPHRQIQHPQEPPVFVPVSNQPHQEPQAPPPAPASSPGRKILINPHFRGEVCLPIPSTESGMIVNPPPYDSKPPSTVAPYQQNPSYNPPPVYNQDNMMNVAPMVYNAPPPNMQYGQPEYHPQGLPLQNVPQPNAWQPQELGPPPTSYANPPPVIMNYGDPIAQPPPNFHGNYNPAYQPQVPYQNLNVPPPQPVYNPQPPVQVHMPPPTYSQPPVSSAMIPQMGPQEHHYPPPHSTPPQNMQKPYHEQRNNNHNMPPPNQRNNNMQNQRFQRPSLDKRPSSSSAKHVPSKMPRLENKKVIEKNKKNTHVNNSNIREIPLVDTSAVKSNLVAKVTPTKPQGEVENWDEYLKEELEKQRRRREEIFKVKEERRKQNAIRLQAELRKREMEKNASNNISVQRVVQAPKGMNRVQAAPKGNVRERIGIPMAKTVGMTKKKVVVVRKKNQNDAPPPNNQPKLPVKQRVGLKPGQNPAVQVQKKIIRTNPNTAAANPNAQPPTKPAVQAPTTAAPKAASAKPPPQQPAAKKTPAAPSPKANKQSPKQNKMQQRLGRRDFHRSPRMQGPPPGMPPRFNSPHPFMEPPMRFPPDMRMGPRGMFNDHRPPLLCDRPPHPFLMDGPRFRMPGFRGFPPGDAPPFPPNHHMQRPGMRFDHPPFQRPPRFQKNRLRAGSVSSQRGSSGTGGSPGSGAKSPARNVKGGGTGNQGPDNSAKGVSESYSVSVEHISSSTNEASLKTMASTVGVVKEVHVESDKKRAVITFAETSQAEAFQKKFQRYMLDLSMIQVSLLAA